MADTLINIEQDLNAVNEQLTRMVDELNKLNNARDNAIQQIQNLQGVAMYLRGKIPTEETSSVDADVPTEDAIEMSAEYPTDTES